MKDKTDPTGKSTSSYVSDVEARFTKSNRGPRPITSKLDRINAINAAQSGGTAIEKEKLATLQAEVAGRKDDIAAAERLVEATKRQLADAHSLTEQRKLQSDLASAEVSLKDRQNAAQEAQLRLSIGQAQGRGDAAGQRDAEVALATFKQSLYAKDSAEYKEAEGEKAAALRQFAETEKRVALEGAEADIKSAQSATQAKIRELEMQLRSHVINEQTKVAATEAALAQEIAKEREAIAQELALDNLRPAERKKILDQLAQLEQQYAQEIQQTQVEAADQSAKAWMGLAKSVQGIADSQLRGLLERNRIVLDRRQENGRRCDVAVDQTRREPDPGHGAGPVAQHRIEQRGARRPSQWPSGERRSGRGGRWSDCRC